MTAVGDGLTYQWQYKSARDGKWYNTKTTGYDTATMSIEVTAARDGMEFRCKVTDAYGNTATSEPAALHMAADPVSITGQPEDYSGPVGATASFTVTAVGDGLTYQWQYKSLKDGKWYNTTASGYNTATMSIEVTAARDGMEFRCKVTDAYGNTAISAPAALHMAAVLEITSQPADFTGPLGATASFPVTASGDGLTYQWQYKSLKDGKWYNTTASGYNTATMSIEVTAARDGMEFRCKVTDAYGNTLTSDPAAIHAAVEPENPVIREFDFETDPAAEGWTFVDADGDGFGWEWSQTNSTEMDAYRGEYFLFSKSYDNGTSAALTPDNWAVSPAIDLSGVMGPVSLSFYAKAQDPAYPAEHFAVYVGTSADIGAMDMVVAESVANAPWQQYTADLSAYAGQSQIYVAIRHFNCTDMFMLDVDYVQILRGTV